jgi:hypothetical protein
LLLPPPNVVAVVVLSSLLQLHRLEDMGNITQRKLQAAVTTDEARGYV